MRFRSLYGETEIIVVCAALLAAQVVRDFVVSFVAFVGSSYASWSLTSLRLIRRSELRSSRLDESFGFIRPYRGFATAGTLMPCILIPYRALYAQPELSILRLLHPLSGLRPDRNSKVSLSHSLSNPSDSTGAQTSLPSSAFHASCVRSAAVPVISAVVVRRGVPSYALRPSSARRCCRLAFLRFLS